MKGRQNWQRDRGAEEKESERERERQGWRNALRSNGCLETVVKETMSPRVLWHLKCPIFMLIFRKRRFLFILTSHPQQVSETDGDKHNEKVNPFNGDRLGFIQHVWQNGKGHIRHFISLKQVR